MVAEQEFHTMVDELLYQEPASFAMLCDLAQRVLHSSVCRWCAADEVLCGRHYEEDIMQEIYLRLIKTTVTHFLLRDEAGGTVNMDPDGFEDWMFRVALNIKKDFANRVRRILHHTTDLVDVEGCEPAGEERWDRIHNLSRAFEIVLNSDAQVYKVLTWVAQCLYMMEQDVTKIESNELIIRTFGEKTLFQMRDMLMAAAQRVSWLRVTPEQQQKIDDSLNEPFDPDRVYGQVKYQDFFMKKGGKATISDWVNRMNSMIKRVMANEACNC